ncbi:MAG TPA: type II secretion system protein GspD [Verrucomicrobia bacterium]|nr:MAG: type II secretion system protein GspD [Lentisphaerae bacterium GWF2_57_35]HBA83260.1 type II secretion system protein GspD [Verrucomicrobiota bacterium]
MTYRLKSLFVAVLLGGWTFTSGVDATNEPAQPYVNFSFDQVDIRLLVKLVGELTGKRFIVNDAVSGKVTVITPPQIPAEEVYPLFLSVLEASGYTVLESGNAYNIVPLPDRGLAMPPVVGAGDKEGSKGLITKVIAVQNVSVIELKKILDPLMRGAKTGSLAAFGTTNHLIVTDTAENVARLERILAELDKPGASRVVEIVKLAHAAAEDVAGQIIAAMQGLDSAGNRINRHFQQMAEGSGSLPTDVMVVPSPQANSLILVGTPMQLNEIRKVVQLMDVESTTGFGRLNSIFLKYLSAEEASKNLNALLAKSVEKDQRQRMAIEPSIPNNALIVDASPQDFEYVRRLVETLDRMPQQVMVEVLIAEVTLGKNLDLGVEWSNLQIPGEGETSLLGRSRLGAKDELSDIVTKSIFPQGLALGVAHGTYTDSSGKVLPNIPFYIKALAQNKDIRILSNVPLWAQNNTEASVSVVNNIPILKSTIEGGAGTARDVIQNIDRVDVGIKLKLTPHVNPDRQILMQLNPSIEAIVDEGPSGTLFAPTIAKREVSTTVTVPDQSTVIISGLIREDRVKSVSKIPLLGDIPLIGFLFRSQTERRERTNLLIFVTPHIVTEMEAADVMKKRLEKVTSMENVTTNLNATPFK